MISAVILIFYRPLVELLAGSHRTLRFRKTEVQNHSHRQRVEETVQHTLIIQKSQT